MLTHHNHNKYKHMHIYTDSTDLISDYHALLLTFFFLLLSFNFMCQVFFSLQNFIIFFVAMREFIFSGDKSPFLEKISQFYESNHYFLGHKIQSFWVESSKQWIFFFCVNAIEFSHKNCGLLTILFEILSF